MSSKVPVRESEKNNKVLMNNWSLDLMLQKEMGRLGKSERTVLNRFTMDQKLLHKRYKKMIHQSKLNLARITSDHEMEKELRSKTAFRFNTNIGEDGDNEMLKRIWDYGRRRAMSHTSDSTNADGTSPTGSATKNRSISNRIKSAPAAGRNRKRILSASSTKCSARTESKRSELKEGVDGVSSAGVYLATAPRSLQASGASITDAPKDCTHMNGENKEGIVEKSDNNIDHNLRPTTSLSVHRPSVSQRPVTAGHRLQPNDSGANGIRTDDNEVKFINRVASANASIPVRKRKEPVIDLPDVVILESEEQKEKQTSNDQTHNTIETEQDNSIHNNIEAPGEPSGQFLETYITASVPPKHSVSSIRSGNQKEPRNLREFIDNTVSKEPGGRPNLLDIQKVRIRLADYNKQVQDFGERVAGLRAPSSAITDYYTSRMMEEGRKTRGNATFQPIVTMDNPPEHEMKRYVGNTKLKSITFKTLDTNFEQRQSTFIEFES